MTGGYVQAINTGNHEGCQTDLVTAQRKPAYKYPNTQKYNDHIRCYGMDFGQGQLPMTRKGCVYIVPHETCYPRYWLELTKGARISQKKRILKTFIDNKLTLYYISLRFPFNQPI